MAVGPFPLTTGQRGESGGSLVRPGPGGSGLDLVFTVPGVPKPQGSKTAAIRGKRAVVVEAGSAETQRAFHAWRTAVRRCAREAMTTHGLQVFETAVHVRILFVMPRPAKPTYAEPRTKPDLDKLVRAVFDSISSPPAPKSDTAKAKAKRSMQDLIGREIGPVLVDDSQIISLRTAKIYATGDDPAGAVIEVRSTSSPVSGVSFAPAASLFDGEGGTDA
jgi:Holliday junction resolvase RusA-like endonuclease